MQVNLRGNKFGSKGWCAIFDALRDNPNNKIAKWDLSDQGINPTIAKSLAAYAAISASLTKVRAAAIPWLGMPVSAVCCLHSSMSATTTSAMRARRPSKRLCAAKRASSSSSEQAPAC